MCLRFAVLQRRQPRRPHLTWAYRALLAALLNAIPKARRQGLRLLATPDTILRWHRDIIRAAGPPDPSPAGPATRPPAEHQGPGPPASQGEPRMGIPPDSRRAGRPGSQGRGVDRMGDPQGQRHRPRAAADRAGLVAVPALPGRGDPGLRLLQRRPARRHPGPRPDRDRARDPADPHPRRHAASNRGLDRPAGPQPPHGPPRPGRARQVHDPRPWLQLHDRVRRGPRRCRDPDRADAPHERHRRTLDRGYRRELLDRALIWNQAHLRQILREYENHHSRHRPHRSCRQPRR